MSAMALTAAGAFVFLFAWISLSRVGYPYDLEWMEGGMLTHSLRLLEGKSLFGPPSVAFIPYIYQPLYSMIVALFGTWFGLSLPLARCVSIVSTWLMAGLLFRTVQRETGSLAVAAAGLGMLFALYPVTGFWYDLARVDSLFMALVFLSLFLAKYHGDRPWTVVAVTVLMVAAYFTKQTALLFVPLAFPVLASSRPSSARVFLATTFFAIAGISLAAHWLTDGWYTYYVQRIVAAEPTNWERIHRGFWVKAASDLPLVLGAAAVSSMLDLAGRPLRSVARKTWHLATVAGMVSGVLSYSWQGGFDNNFIPFYVFAIVPACRALAWAWKKAPAPWALAASTALLAQFFILIYDPVKQVPTAEEIADGQQLVDLLASSPGAVLVPEHPWYAVLAGKQPSYHSMALEDLRHEQKGVWPQDLRDRLRSHYYDMVVICWDPKRRSLGNYPPELRTFYRKDQVLRFRGRAMGSYVGTWARPTLVYRPRLEHDASR